VTFDLLTAVGADEAMAAVFAEDRAVGDWLAVEAALTHGLAAGVIDDASAARIIAACTPEGVDREVLWSDTAMSSCTKPISPALPPHLPAYPRINRFRTGSHQ
jgi:hypothetical protein